MGLHFSLDHANLIGWLTQRDFPSPIDELFFAPIPWDKWVDYVRYRRLGYFETSQFEPKAWRAPRVPLQVLRDFLDSLPESMVTRYPEDHQSLFKIVLACRKRLPRETHRNEILSSRDVAVILAPLRVWFQFPIYFLLVGEALPLERLRETPAYTLWLEYNDDRKESTIHDLLDPFPALRSLFATGSFAPVTLCWTGSGETALIPRDVASAPELIALANRVPPHVLWLELKSRDKTTREEFNLLQISDLHFGARTVTRRKLEYVEGHLQRRIEETRAAGGIVQAVVTGDLMDTPSHDNLSAYEDFGGRLANYCGMPVVCVPGNHDVKRNGFLWPKWDVLSGFNWQPVVSSDPCRIVFVCFDTSKDANLARGRITDDQFLKVATKLRELDRHGDYSAYVRVALVHHHPFSRTEDEVETLPYIGLKEERFLRMKNGEHLVRWCAAQNIPLILHGHKHWPRFVGQEIDLNGSTHLVRAVGSGSSLGIDDKPLSFNWMTWQPTTRKWTVSFFADPGDGSGFAERRLVVGPA